MVLRPYPDPTACKNLDPDTDINLLSLSFFTLLSLKNLIFSIFYIITLEYSQLITISSHRCFVSQMKPRVAGLVLSGIQFHCLEGPLFLLHCLENMAGSKAFAIAKM